MYRHTCTKRIRYGETDRMGYLYYGNYPLLYEIGRTEALRALGFSYQRLEDELNVFMPVAALDARYKRPIYYDENIEIVTILREMPSKMVTFETELINPNGEIVHTASVRLAFVSGETKKVIEVPDVLKRTLEPYFT